MPFKHTATLPDGTVAKRTSASRQYSHMVATRRSYEEAMRRNTSADMEASERRNYKWESFLASLQPDTSVFVPMWNRTCERGFKAAEIEQARGLIAGRDEDTYVAERKAARIASLEEQKAAGEFDRWADGGWASRLDLAHKNAATHQANPYYAEVRIIPAVIG